MDSAMQKMKKPMNLTEDEEGVFDLTDLIPSRHQDASDLVLYAKVLTGKKVWLSTFKNQMAQHWNGRFPVTITESSDMFSLSFGCEGDKVRALLREPFHFQNHHIVLYSPTQGQTVNSDSLIYTPFWVQIFRLPFLSKTKGIAMALGNIIGEYVDVFEDSLSEGWGPFLRVRVKLDITKPLLRGKMITLHQAKEEFWVEFRYERLPEYCMECGRLGHPFDKCSVYLEKLDNGIEPDLEYRPTMKGAPLPISNYDRYRTDFSKGNAWPLLTRLAKTSLISAIPNLKNRESPNPTHLLMGESSQPRVGSSATSIGVSIPEINIPGVNRSVHSGFDIATSTEVSIPAVTNTAMSSGITINGSKSMHTASTLASKPGVTTAQQNCNLLQFSAAMSQAQSQPNSKDNVADLSRVFTPLAAMDVSSNFFATYPPTNATVQASSPFSQLISPVPTRLYHNPKSIITASAEPHIGKENLSPNRLSKRTSESLSLRQTLKRCRGNQAQFMSSLSGDTESHFDVSIDNMDSTGDKDNSAESESQLRKQP